MAMVLLQLVCKICLDLFALFIVFLPWILFQRIGKPFQRGFYCNDESISYPYRGSTVESNVLTAVGFVLAFTTILVIEVVHQFFSQRDPPSFQITKEHFIPHFLARIYKYFGMFLMGLAVQQTITNIGKYSIGRLRPHFFDVCKPDFSTLNCTMQAEGGAHIFLYIQDYECLDDTSHQSKESRLSFPSGHSSFSTFVAIYLTLYLQSRATWKMARAFKVILQVLMIYGAIFTCLSRVSDNKHHYTDVFTGAFIGFFVACIAAIHGTDLYRPRVGFTSPHINTYNNTVTANNDRYNYNYNSNNNDNVVVNMEDRDVRVCLLRTVWRRRRRKRMMMMMMMLMVVMVMMMMVMMALEIRHQK